MITVQYLIRSGKSCLGNLRKSLELSYAWILDTEAHCNRSIAVSFKLTVTVTEMANNQGLICNSGRWWNGTADFFPETCHPERPEKNHLFFFFFFFLVTSTTDVVELSGTA